MWVNRINIYVIVISALEFSHKPLEEIEKKDFLVELFFVLLCSKKTENQSI